MNDKGKYTDDSLDPMTEGTQVPRRGGRFRRLYETVTGNSPGHSGSLSSHSDSPPAYYDHEERTYPASHSVQLPDETILGDLQRTTALGLNHSIPNTSSKEALHTNSAEVTRRLQSFLLACISRDYLPSGRQTKIADIPHWLLAGSLFRYIYADESLPDTSTLDQSIRDALQWVRINLQEPAQTLGIPLPVVGRILWHFKLTNGTTLPGRQWSESQLLIASGCMKLLAQKLVQDREHVIDAVVTIVPEDRPLRRRMIEGLRALEKKWFISIEWPKYTLSFDGHIRRRRDSERQWVGREEDLEENAFEALKKIEKKISEITKDAKTKSRSKSNIKGKEEETSKGNTKEPEKKIAEDSGKANVNFQCTCGKKYDFSIA